MGTVDITGIDKAALLAALYNASQPLGMGFLQYDPADMTVEQAQEIINMCKQRYEELYKRKDNKGEVPLSFDYLKGRVMKVAIHEDFIYTDLYNRDNGDGAAEEVIAKLRAE
jgi:hypothetical protein